MKKRLLISLIVLLGLIVLYRGSYWITFSKIPRDPYAYITLTPREISITPVTNKTPFSIAIADLNFQQPFGDPTKQEDNNEMSYVEFANNKKIIFLKVEEGTYSQDLDKDQKELLSQTFGSDLMDDDYRLMSKAIKITPDDFTWFSLESNKKLAAKFLLFTIKIVALPNVEDNIYSFETESIRGFQRGEPSQRDILLHIFDRTNHHPYYYEILLVGNFTQEDIDMILQSLQFD